MKDCDIEFLAANYSSLTYNHEKNVIVGTLAFDLKYEHVDEEAIIDEYEIEIDFNNMSAEGLPLVRETAGRILNIAKNKGLEYYDLHLNNPQAEMCIIIPPKVKERYPNGFDLKIFLEHVEEHLYWISYFERYNIKPWKEYGHYEKGYLELYLEDRALYGEDVKRYFNIYNRKALRKKIRDLKRRYKI